jgi:hypothetical protein
LGVDVFFDTKLQVLKSSFFIFPSHFLLHFLSYFSLLPVGVHDTPTDENQERSQQS